LGSRCDLRLLHIGCGTSSMPEQMLQDGFVQQVCIDSSDVAIMALSQKFASLEGQHWDKGPMSCSGAPSLQFLALDATNSGLGSDSFDIVIDKGTLDAQVGGPKGMSEVAATLSEVVRMLRANGVYVQISHSDKRSLLLDKSFKGLLRPWHLDSSDATVPFSVPAPIVYAQGKQHDTLPSAQQKRRRKDTTYIYIYRKNGAARNEL